MKSDKTNKDLNKSNNKKESAIVTEKELSTNENNTNEIETSYDVAADSTRMTSQINKIKPLMRYQELVMEQPVIFY